MFCQYKERFVLFCFNFFNVYSFLRDRVQVGEGQKDRGTQSPKQAPGSELSAQSPMWGLNSWAARSWPEPKSDAQPTEPPRNPIKNVLISILLFCFVNLFLSNCRLVCCYKKSFSSVVTSCIIIAQYHTRKLILVQFTNFIKISLVLHALVCVCI